jgi:LacI family transcriptional regulator
LTTIRDVAKRLDLSITTVSRALDGYPDVAEKTRQLVSKTALDMGYIPNRAARQLRKQKSDTIGYILPASVPQFSDPFFSEFIAGLGDEASSRNFDLLVSTASADSDTEQMAYQRWVHSRKVDGVILNRMRLSDWRVNFLTQMELPFASLERSLDDFDYPSVEVDAIYGFKSLLDHLLENGHRRIAYIGGPAGLKIQSDRYHGYRQALEHAGIAYDPNLVVDGDTSRTSGYRAAKQLLLLPNPPTAITCINDLSAIGVLHAANEQGYVVGQDLAVAGFDGIADSEHTLPPLTTLDQPLYDIARQLVKMLIAQLTGESLPEHRIIFQPKLIIRQSTTRKSDGAISQH